MYDVFISHSSKDKADLVRPLSLALESCGLKVWLDEQCINEGDSISQSIFKGLSDSRCVILIVSKETWKSNWSFLESGYFIASREDKKIIPVLYGVSHSRFAGRFPFMADKKYITADSTSTQLEELVTRITQTISDIRSNDLLALPFSMREIIHRLNSYDIFKTSELLRFIRYYEKSKKEPASVIWAEKIIQRIVFDLTNGRYLSSQDVDLFENILKIQSQINDIIIGHFLFIVRLQKLFLETADISNHQSKLLNYSMLSILDWYTRQIIPNPPKLNETLSLEQIPIGTFSKDDIIETFEIEKLTLRSDLISDWEESYLLYEHNPCYFLGVRDSCTQKVIAFCTLLPVSDEWYNQFIQGDLVDNSIDLSYIRKYDLPDFYNVYISSICVHPNYQGRSNAFTILYNSIIEMFLNLAQQQEIYVYKFLAEASTLDGERLCKFIDLREIRKSLHNTYIYESYLIPPALRLKSRMGKNLIDYYEAKYEDLYDLLRER